MLMQAVDTYLAVRRAVDFKLKAVEGYYGTLPSLPPPKVIPIS